MTPLRINQLNEVLRLLRGGASSRRIAVELRIGRNTLRRYRLALSAAGLLECDDDSMSKLETLKTIVPRTGQPIVVDRPRQRAIVDPESAPDLLAVGQSLKPILPKLRSRKISTVDRFAMTHRLSPKETQLLKLAIAGLNNKEAAAKLCCQRPTVSTYWNRIFSKCGFRTQRDVLASMIRADDENQLGA